MGVSSGRRSFGNRFWLAKREGLPRVFPCEGELNGVDQDLPLFPFSPWSKGLSPANLFFSFVLIDKAQNGGRFCCSLLRTVVWIEEFFFLAKQGRQLHSGGPLPLSPPRESFFVFFSSVLFLFLAVVGVTLLVTLL